MAAREPIVCDVAVLGPDAASIGVLARLRLGARRAGVELRFHGASRELRELLAFAGLERVLRVEPGGQTEEGEEPLGVEEERQLPDPPV
jgi:hypothetical protein